MDAFLTEVQATWQDNYLVPFALIRDERMEESNGLEVGYELDSGL